MISATHIRKLRDSSAALLGAVTLGLVGLGATGLLVAACGGSVNASAKAKAGTDSGADADFDAEGSAAWDTVDASQSEEDTALDATPSSQQTAAGAASSEMALLGARHDLTIGTTTAACNCLAVVLGQPSSVGLVWQGQRPRTNPETQLVIALGSDGVPCAQAGPGASYWGYESKNGDVIVKVEGAVAGRPVTHGAIIPRPAEGKQVYIEPNEAIPYGKGLGGEARCALGRGR